MVEGIETTRARINRSSFNDRIIITPCLDDDVFGPSLYERRVFFCKRLLEMWQPDKKRLPTSWNIAGPSTGEIAGGFPTRRPICESWTSPATLDAAYWMGNQNLSQNWTHANETAFVTPYWTGFQRDSGSSLETELYTNSQDQHGEYHVPDIFHLSDIQNLAVQEPVTSYTGPYVEHSNDVYNYTNIYGRGQLGYTTPFIPSQPTPTFTVSHFPKHPCPLATEFTTYEPLETKRNMLAPLSLDWPSWIEESSWDPQSQQSL